MDELAHLLGLRKASIDKQMINTYLVESHRGRNYLLPSICLLSFNYGIINFLCIASSFNLGGLDFHGSRARIERDSGIQAKCGKV